MIKVLKLITGEDIIADVQSIDDNVVITNDTYYLKNAMRIGMSQEGIAMVPLIMFGEDKNYQIKVNHVICMSTPIEEVYNGYNSRFGSGIVLPGTKLHV